MIAETELKDYRNLCTTLGNLREKLHKRKLELIELLEQTAARRREAFLVLAKANRLTRHLTGRQRYIAGLQYNLREIKTRISEAVLPSFRESVKEAEITIEPFNNIITVIGIIENIKKNLLQLDLLEKRCRELLLAIKKALEAFRFEFKKISRKIYPYGIFSSFYRKIRSVFGNTYFTSGDMAEIGALGTITALVLKIADSPFLPAKLQALWTGII